MKTSQVSATTSPSQKNSRFISVFCGGIFGDVAFTSVPNGVFFFRVFVLPKPKIKVGSKQTTTKLGFVYSVIFTDSLPW